MLPAWAQQLRNEDERWQRLSQDGVNAFRQLIMGEGIPFAFETVFSHWVENPDGTVESKADEILKMQQAGYFVVLLFVGLSDPQLSMARVSTRKTQGGHDVPIQKLWSRFPRTQKAIAHAAPLADMTLMFDNSLSEKEAFSLVRVQRKQAVLYDCRDERYSVSANLRHVAKLWLSKVAGDFRASPESPAPRKRVAKKKP
jgi:predicted ABC-type ATPase